MTHLGKIFRFCTNSIIKINYLSFLLLRNLRRPKDAPIPTKISIPVIGTGLVGSPGSPGWAIRVNEIKIRKTTIVIRSTKSIYFLIILLVFTLPPLSDTFRR